MKALQIHQYGGPEELELVELPDPTAQPNQVVVKVRAASLNPIELKQASGKMKELMPLSFPWTPGADFSGVIESIGEGVSEYSVGDEMYGFQSNVGAYAEKLVVDVKSIALKPTTIGHIQAASIGLVGQTASQGLDATKIGAGQTVLIHGAGGAVGGLAVQLAYIRGVRVIANSTADDAERLREYGAAEVIDYNATPFETVVNDVDAVLDAVGGDTQQRSFGVIKTGGYLVALSQPPSPDEVAKHNIHGVMLNTMPSSTDLTMLAGYIDAGKLQTNVVKTYPLTDAAQAWQDTIEHKVSGKIVFVVSQ